jgi:hypothetical protein
MITPGRNPSGWESGCGAADPSLSNIATTAYAGTGYSPMASGEVGAINPGLNTPVTPGPAPAQTRVYVQGNQLIILDNQTGTAYAVPLASQIPQPAIYSPTK